MPTIERDEVESIARLARLELSEAEIAGMTRDLGQILEYVATLESLDTEGIEPTSHVMPLPTPARPDRAAPAMDPELALSNAPMRDDSAFVVPQVLDSDDEG